MSNRKDRVVVPFSDWLAKESSHLPAEKDGLAWDAARETQTDPGQISELLQHRHPRIGVDLGREECRIVFPSKTGDGREEILIIPSVIGIADENSSSVQHATVGKQALMRRHRLQLTRVLNVDVRKDAQVWKPFCTELRTQLERCGCENAWAVVACSATANPEDTALERAIANELFDRVLFVDPCCLAALGLEETTLRSTSVVVDCGTDSIRATLMEGRTPSPENRVEVSFGGRDLDAEIRLGIALRYPELLLTDHTVQQLKERLSFVPPVQRRSTVSLAFQGAERRIDLTDIVRENCETLARNVQKAVQEVLARCPSDQVDTAQQNIILTGGCAEVRGLDARIERELHADGLEKASVKKPANASLLAAKGAFRWARQLPVDGWSIPLFSFGA